jgi:hypothetical protein
MKSKSNKHSKINKSIAQIVKSMDKEEGKHKLIPYIDLAIV